MIQERQKRRKKKKWKKRLAAVLITVTLLLGAGVLGMLVYGVIQLENETGLPAENAALVPVNTPIPPPPSPTSTPVPVTPAPEVPAKRIQVSFPTGEANRAALTAMTNYYAADVRSGDGSYDPSRFHNFSDTGGTVSDYLIYDWQTGIWKPVDENTWHVDNLELHAASGINRTVSLNVAKNGEWYVVSNVNVLVSSDGVTGSIDTGISCFWVAEARIAEDRVFR